MVMNKQELRDLYPRGTRVRNTLSQRTATVTHPASDYGFSPTHLRIQVEYDDAKKDRRGNLIPTWVKWQNLAPETAPTNATLAALIGPEETPENAMP